MKYCFFFLAIILFSCHSENRQVIDRYALIMRNNPHLTDVDTLSSLSVGNGGFAFTVDVTGLQTFPESYKNGVPLGTESQWGWHSFSNRKHFVTKDVLKPYNFGKGHEELYACQFEEKHLLEKEEALFGTVPIDKIEGTKRQKEASEWLRMNPHRLHLGIVGLELESDTILSSLTDIDQTLDMWEGKIKSSFVWEDVFYQVQTVCHPSADMVSAKIVSSSCPSVKFCFPYPTGGHTDNACDWNSNEKHTTSIIKLDRQSVVLKRIIDSTKYYVKVDWEGGAVFKEKKKNYFVLVSQDSICSFTCQFVPDSVAFLTATFEGVRKIALDYWKNYWMTGGVVDFSHCTDLRAKELERRIVLSQYLLAIQCAGNTPPQETGLTYNSWYGKSHLEMTWWHQAHFALWGHPEILERTLTWYQTVMPIAYDIAERQGFDGVRWMKMTDPWGGESPSNIGSFLIWQQPHPIYLAELVYRANPSAEIINRYNDLVQETAKFMVSFVVYDKDNDRYLLQGAVPAQETLRAWETINPPFELSYWHFALQVAQQWRERIGLERIPEWDILIAKLSKLAYDDNYLYLAAETAVDTYNDIRFTSDHMAVLGAVGVLPMNDLLCSEYMRNTLHWIWDNWNWDKTWGWDFPLTAMNAARLGEPEKAVGALLMNKRTNTYLPNGHNYQDSRLRIYLPGNGGLLTAIAMMCAGWDGVNDVNPGFPKDGTWDVRWEGLLPLP